jgi:phage portal protein BeeE
MGLLWLEKCGQIHICIFKTSSKSGGSPVTDHREKNEKSNATNNNNKTTKKNGEKITLFFMSCT